MFLVKIASKGTSLRTFNRKHAGLVRIWQGRRGGGQVPLPPVYLPYSKANEYEFGGVILRQDLYQEIIKHLMTLSLGRFRDVNLYFRLLYGRKKVGIRNFFVFHPIWLKFGIGGNFEMLLTKRKPKLKFENDLSKKCNFLPILAKIIPSNLQQSLPMARVDVLWDWFVLKMKAY